MEEGKKLIGDARARLILRSPFFASIALHLKVILDNTQPTMATDSVVLKYNDEFVQSLSKDHLLGIMCHEVLHIALLHTFRRQNRNPLLWNIACDYAINSILHKDSDLYKLPSDCLYSAEFEGMEAEEIYERLLKDKDKHMQISVMRLVGNVEDYEENKKDNPDNETYSAHPDEQQQKTKMIVAQAANIAKMAGKLPASVERLVHEMLTPKIPWKEVLARFITQNVKNDYTWKLPNKRHLYNDLYLPQLNDPTLDTIAVIIDTSGSVCQKELTVFASELKSIFHSYPNTQAEVIYVDSEVAGHESVSMEDVKFNAKGGGGTDFRPGFSFIDKKNLLPACILYFTDGYCNSFPKSCEIPTLWLLTSGTSFDPPFGEVIHLDLDNYNK